jgi:hypothetical protein
MPAEFRSGNLMRKAVCAVALGLALVLADASAARAAAQPYTTSHGAATLTGTHETVWYLLLLGNTTVTGTLTTASGECYRVLTSNTSTPGGTERARQCGPGSASFTATFPQYQTKKPVYVFLCRGDDTSDCSTPLLF